ncbi:hypothetical protein HWV62_5522 [Athelia sp. TMB]|nr:hypothetical protein HWV62_5522 [Athelia sp. TMB]
MMSVCPPFMYGPLALGFSAPVPDYGALSTDLNVFRLLKPDGIFPSFSSYVDVRDVARAHVAALEAQPQSILGRKRIVMSSPHGLDLKAALEMIARERPELENRLVDLAKMPKYDSNIIPVDLSRVDEVLGISPESYFSWESTILDTVDSLIALEKEWKSKGFSVEIPNSV